MVAYNLMSLFRHFGLNSHNQVTLATLRSYCFAIGGWVIQHARKRVLKLSLPPQKALLDGRDLPPNRGPTTTVPLLHCIIRVNLIRGYAVTLHLAAIFPNDTPRLRTALRAAR
jgi:hypothetical protein